MFNLLYRKSILKDFKHLFEDIRTILKRERCFFHVIPRTSTLFLTYRCNSHCHTCTFWQRPMKEEKLKEIGIDEWKIVIDKLVSAGVKEAEIFGGNVLLRKELLIDILKYLRQKDFVIYLPTNQIGLDEDITEAIVSTVDVVYISTDGVGEHQDMIRGQQGAFQRAENTITKILKLRQNQKTPRLVCNTTVSKYNVGILENVIEYALASGFDEIHFEYAGEMTQKHIDHSAIDGLKPTPYYVQQDGESILVDRGGAKLLKESLKRIRGKYANSNIRITSVNIDILSEENLYAGTIPHDKCYIERTDLVVDPSGNMVACHFFNNYIIGNLVKQPFETVWNSVRHRHFRRHQNKGDIEMCKHCILGVQRNPGLLTSLKRIYLTRAAKIV